MRRGWNTNEVPVYVKRTRACLVVFAVQLLIVMGTRGAGFYFLGSDAIGGTQYVLMLVSIWAVLFGLGYNAPSHIQKPMFIAFVVSGFFLFACQLLIVRGAYWIKRFVNVDTLNLEAVIGEGMRSVGGSDELLRFASLDFVSLSLLAVSAILWHRKKYFWVILTMASGFGASMACGFRRSVLSFGIISFLFLMLHARSKMKTFWVCMAGGLIGVGFAYIIAPSAPEVVQRSLAFLPGIHIDAAMAKSAAHSSEWRVELWGYCLAEAPRYLLVGKGALMKIHEYQASYGALNIAGTLNPEMGFLLRAYHSLPLALLVDLGLVSLISYYAALVFAGIYFYKRGARLRGEALVRFYFFFALWINRNLHQLYTTGLTWRFIENMLWILIMVVMSSGELRAQKKSLQTG